MYIYVAFGIHIPNNRISYVLFLFSITEVLMKFAALQCSNISASIVMCRHVIIESRNHLQAMNSQSVLAMEQIATPDKTGHASAPSVLFDAKLDHHSLMDGTLASTSQSSNIKTELIRSSSLSRSLSVNLQKRSPESDPDSPQSHVSHPKFSEPMFSNSSTFCTSLFSSSSTKTEPCRQMCTLPFLPHPPKCEQHVSAGQSSSSSLLLNGDTGNGLDEAEQSDDLKDFLDLSGDASDGSFRENNALAFDEQMEFQFLSEQLGIAITDNEKSPHLDVS
jgi:hypothetical protein